LCLFRFEKPHFDSGELKKLGDVATPWPAFCFVSGLNLSLSQEKALDVRDKLFPAIAEGVDAFLADEEAAVERICADHGHQKEDARLWLSRCRYAVSSPSSPSSSAAASSPLPPMAISREKYSSSIDVLKSVGLVPASFVVDELWNDETNACIVVP